MGIPPVYLACAQQAFVVFIVYEPANIYIQNFSFFASTFLVLFSCRNSQMKNLFDF